MHLEVLEDGDEQVARVVVELTGGGDLLDDAVLHDDDAGAQRHGLGLVVGDVDDGGAQALMERGDLGAHLDTQLGVQVGERLVHEEDLGLTDDGAAHGDTLSLAAGEGRARVRVRAERPVKGALLLRVPDYAEDPAFTRDGADFTPDTDRGYAVIPVDGAELTVGFRFDMTARVVYANPLVSADSGKVAVRKGPLVYCLEEADNGEGLASLRIDTSKALREVPGGGLRDSVTVEAEGLRLQ